MTTCDLESARTLRVGGISRRARGNFTAMCLVFRARAGPYPRPRGYVWLRILYTWSNAQVKNFMIHREQSMSSI